MELNVIIRKQKITIQTTDEQLAFQVRKQLTDKLQFDLISMMERVFPAIDPDTYINIARLKIDLGCVTLQQFENDFAKIAEHKLLNEVTRSLDEINNKQNDQQNSEDYTFQLNSGKQQELDALFHFLEKGSYPWWYKKERRKTPGQLFDALDEEHTTALLLKIISAKNTGSNNLNNFMERLFIHLPAEKSKLLIDQLVSLFNDSQLSENLNSLVGNKQDIIQLFSISEKSFYHHLFNLLLLPKNENHNNIIHDLIIQLNDEKNISAHELKIPVKNLLRKPPGNTEGIYIGNAGLILLHPFLLSLFDKLALLDAQNQFISLDAQNKAVVLLYYLQTGNASYLEWEMALNKIFVALSLMQ